MKTLRERLAEGVPINLNVKVVKVADAPKPTAPGAIQRAKNFAAAAVDHVKAGRPRATDEQVAERYAICLGCDLYHAKTPGNGQCLHPSCGCSLKAVGVKGLNKLRWADQACPAGKWAAVEPPQAADSA